MFSLDKEVVAVLTRNGWSHDRDADISPYVSKLKDEGWAIFDSAELFLRSFNDLPQFTHPVLARGVERFYIDCSLFIGGGISNHCTREWEKLTGIRLYLIDVRDICRLYIDENMLIYETDMDDHIWLTGNNLNSCWRYLLLGAKPVQIFDLPERDDDVLY